ncbi:MAG: TonB-dependent receptor [Candidatus Aminicenantes bacterium]|nr:TonB-dependent receptor [Candidatus Aminicenantes bacterium]
MRKQIFVFTLIFFLIIASLQAQELTGSLKGTVTDIEGNPLPGVAVTISSPAIMGTQSFITTETGSFRFPSLPPGTYKVVAELKGFKTVERTDVIVRVGMTVTVDIKMEVAAVEEEITVVAASPVVDVQSSKLAVTVDSNMLKNIPMRRDLYDIMTAAPGVVSEGATYRRTFSAHGATVRSNTTAFDGVNMNDPVVMYTITNINFDVMDEVEIITAGHPASIGYTDGAYVNIVTKSGGNRFSGGATVYHTQEGLNQHLWTDEQITAMKIAKPEVDKSWIDGSFTLGGPIMIDKIWFFTNARYIKLERKTNYIGPWTDFFGRTHYPYNWTHEEKMGFIKLTSQLSPKLKFMGMFNMVDIYRPMYEEPGSRTNFISTRTWDHEKGYTGNAIINYILNQNTFVDLRFGYVHRYFPLPLKNEVKDLPLIDDLGDLYNSLTTARFNETYLRKRLQTGLYFTRFADNLLGGSHEIKAGIEYENTYGDWDWWRKDNMIWYIDSRNPNPYYRYSTYGWVAFYICGPDQGSTKIIDRGGRIGAYLQDAFTFKDRLTLNIGLRFDRSWGWKPAVTKKAAGNPLSVWLGENIVRPWVATNYPQNFPNGLNPWGDATAPEWSNIINWNSFSPRFGLTYDLFGHGRTALKFSFNRYTEYLMLQYFSTLHPFYPRSFSFRWWDTNGDNYPNIGDTFTMYSADFRGMDPEFAKKRLDPNTKSPYNDEFLVGLQHELFRNFSLGINFIYKNKSHILEDSLYNADSGQYWYHIDQAEAKKYWIPFTTTIPAQDDYPARTVTLYIRSNAAPPLFYRFHNVPELYRKYWAIEFIFNKRMSEGWQVNGSIVYSKAYGNIYGFYDYSWGWSGFGDNPNTFINYDGRLDIDRPLQIKLMGTAQLPWKIYLSGYYQFYSGAPWVTSGSVYPPAAWCTANNAYQDYYGVLFESLSKPRRYPSWNQLDLRIEKEFAISKFGRLGIYVDAINVLGYTSVNLGLNDTQYWFPSAEGANQPGTKTLYSSYKVISSVTGVRTIKVSARFSF